jgi:hypothetical protein
MKGPAWKQVGPSNFLRTSLARRQVGKIENLVGGNFLGNVFALARVADGVGDQVSRWSCLTPKVSPVTKDVHVAVGTEIIPQHRTEKTKFHDFPPSAKVSYLFFRDLDIHFAASFFLVSER